MLSIRLNPLQTSLKCLSIVRILQNNHYLLQNGSPTPTVSDFYLFRLQTHKQLHCTHKRFYTVEKFASKDPDVFGDIAGNKFEEFPLDPDEQEQEDFEKNEATVPRRLKLSKGQYADLIKEHIGKGDLQSAVKVLDLVKENRDKPTTYMYNLLLRAYAVQGNLISAWKTFTSMKRRALPLNAATYVSVINACANSPKRELALDRLANIREEMMLKNVVLNEVHYNAMVKAYGRHESLLDAFQIVDQMIDNKVTIGVDTFKSLLYACISNKEHGLRHALVVWHMMHRWRKQPDLLTYNLMLRAIRDTKMGNLKSNDVLLLNYQNSRILVSDSLKPDLLAHPPVVSNIHLPERSAESPDMISQAPIKTSAVVANNGKCEDFKLEEIHEKNKLILFGGFNGFMQRLEADGIQPDVKTITLLLDLVPDSLAIERKLLSVARTHKIALDIDFFNMLIKKRSFRKDYKAAKEVLDDIQRHNLVPDMITWGVLALGCKTLDDAQTLLDGLETAGHTLNPVIAGSLLGNACSMNNIPYILEILKLLMLLRIRPSSHIYTILDKYKRKVEDNLKSDQSTKIYRKPEFRKKFEVFKTRYEKFQLKFNREDNPEYIRDRRSRPSRTTSTVHNYQK
ncbi:pentatricopeptide repeat-containing protein 1, mitochondrial [Diachasmimorpha longicaudata]|uniref:pentatricopeptide repeat-containing protein 1, mitochondrial n=1 Tax=Diachasmimorpha longicaudata TaxID=58733 RepID=UPI0030B88879